ncbi:MAG TPA: CesT family type III secretion system chaperone [Ramlibacter sp.]|nr:CesT family type III secretion system chaperone [Ramlibacter sp.]
MPVHPFEDFCRRICEAAGVAAPQLALDGPDAPAFSIEYQQVAISFVQAANDDAGQAVLLVDFGALPEAGASQAMRVLLEANFLMAGARSPSFGIDPASGHVVYSLGFAVASADGASFCAGLGELAASVHCWRSDAFAAPPHPASLAGGDHAALAGTFA